MHLMQNVVPETAGKVKLGVRAYAAALLVIPKTLAANAGFDAQESLLQLKDERTASGMAVDFSCKTGEPMLPGEEGGWDNVLVKRQSLYLSTVLANQLLLVDEVMRADKQMGKQPNPEDM
jgi:T-complex protein 1 subunit zeta